MSATTSTRTATEGTARDACTVCDVRHYAWLSHRTPAGVAVFAVTCPADGLTAYHYTEDVIL